TLCRTLKSKDQVPLPISGVVHLVQCYGVLTRSRGHPFKPAAVYDVPVALFACNAPPVSAMPKIAHRSPKPMTPRVAVMPPTSVSDSILAFDDEEAVGVEAQLCQEQHLECWTCSPLLPQPHTPKTCPEDLIDMRTGSNWQKTGKFFGAKLAPEHVLGLVSR
ncbi:hypothetical protein B0H14DRAFT_2920625, partial [Mycena olivaceomarginata]